MTAPAITVDSAILEVVAAKVHEDWMQGKLDNGITTRRSESGEELMVPYGKLSEAAKDLDRRTVHSVLSTLPAVGLAVTWTRPDR